MRLVNSNGEEIIDTDELYMDELEIELDEEGEL